MHIIVALILYALFTTKHSENKQSVSSKKGYERAVWLSQSFSRK